MNSVNRPDMLRWLGLGLIVSVVLLISGCGLTKEDIKPLEDKIAKLESRIASLEERVERGASESLKERLERLEREIEALRSRLYERLKTEEQKGTVTQDQPEEPVLEEPPIEEIKEAEDIAGLPKDKREVIEELIDRGVLEVTDGKFRPSDPITLDELLKWVAKLKGTKVDELRAGLKLPERMRSDRKLTREALMVVLLRLSPERDKVEKLKPRQALKYLSTDSSNIDWGEPLYADYKEISRWAGKYVAYAVWKSYYCRTFGIERRYWEDVTKKPRLEPKKLVTRAEAAYALKQILDR